MKIFEFIFNTILLIILAIVLSPFILLMLIACIFAFIIFLPVILILLILTSFKISRLNYELDETWQQYEQGKLTYKEVEQKLMSLKQRFKGNKIDD